MRSRLSPGMYMHYSGKHYLLDNDHIVFHAKTLQKMVIYRGQYVCQTFGKNSLWVRSYHLFFEMIIRDGEEVQRFAYKGPADEVDRKEENDAIAEQVKPGTYRNFRGKLFVVEPENLVHHSETTQEMIVYRALFSMKDFGQNSLWVLPKDLFLSQVTVAGEKIPRFQYLEKEQQDVHLSEVAEAEKNLNIGTMS